MTRLMGDATHDGVPALAAVSGLQLVAPYVTGSPDVIWTAADLAMFPALVQVPIDQGFTGSPVPGAVVRDVETGAWSAAAAVGTVPWTAARPTIYCNVSTLPAVLAAGWQRDLWLAIPGWQPGQPLPATPGCTIVAVQNQQNVGGAYDLSQVLDDSWPEASMQIPGKPGNWAGQPTIWSNPDGSLVWLGVSADDGFAYVMTAPLGGTWGAPVRPI